MAGHPFPSQPRHRSGEGLVGFVVGDRLTVDCHQNNERSERVFALRARNGFALPLSMSPISRGRDAVVHPTFDVASHPVDVTEISIPSVHALSCQQLRGSSKRLSWLTSQCAVGHAAARAACLGLYPKPVDRAPIFNGIGLPEHFANMALRRSKTCQLTTPGQHCGCGVRSETELINRVC